ncbi:hypothetical protein BB561_005067 [Smittium simulii]|uniref:Uncharacterized protein n=1 Tax=Smittium simulii TaxID=133385 RepID=A0A2T9YCH5_9FUNG|nr:hypothetical protein BB561_005067 [Smittium simulii]
MTDQVQLTNSISLASVKKFRGEEIGADLSKWVRTTQRTLMAAGVNSEVQQARLILTYFEGRATLARKAYYNKLNSSTIKYPQEKLKLPQAPNSEISLRQRLIDLKQTGLLEDYISEEKGIVGSANIDGNLKKMVYFINGLVKTTLKAVLVINLRTFDKTKEVALSFVTKKALYSL